MFHQNGKDISVAMGTNEDCLIVSGPGAATPLHDEHLLLGAVNIILGPGLWTLKAHMDPLCRAMLEFVLQYLGLAPKLC